MGFNSGFKGLRVKQSKTTRPLKNGPIGCIETSVGNYHSTLRKSHLLRGESLKLCVLVRCK